jgi:hypothetical protein
MNERIQKLWTKVCQDEMPELDETCMTLQRQEKFAELIVAECNKISKETCDELKADESIQTPGSKINWNLYNGTLRNKLADHFWVEL